MSLRVVFTSRQLSKMPRSRNSQPTTLCGNAGPPSCGGCQREVRAPRGRSNADTCASFMSFYLDASSFLVSNASPTRVLTSPRRFCQCSRGGGLKIMYSTYPVTCRCGERCFRSLSWSGRLRGAVMPPLQHRAADQFLLVSGNASQLDGAPRKFCCPQLFNSYGVELSNKYVKQTPFYHLHA